MTIPGDSYQVVMPKLGLTMTEATIVEWQKVEGDQVEKGEILFVLESEKSMLEIEAPASGRLSILIPAGETVPVHEPIATLAQGAAKVEEKLEALPPDRMSEPLIAAQSPARPTAARHDTERRPAAPKARALARRLGISLKGIAGTGARGMVVAADVEKAASALPVANASPVARRMAESAGLDLDSVPGTGPGGRIMREDIEGAMATEPVTAPPASADEIQPFGGLRAIIAERLSASWRERPHVTLTTEADATNLISARQQAIAESGDRISYDALLVTLVTRALIEQPHINVRLTEQGIERTSALNVGVAIDTDRGLLVPVVRDAGNKSLPEVQKALVRMAERALSGRSLPDDLAGGTFTITNLGMFEIDAFTPIINPPESAILGVGRIVAKPVAVDRQVVVRDMMTLSLSFDHRLIDGAPAARFLQRVKQLVERPFALALGCAEGAQTR